MHIKKMKNYNKIVTKESHNINSTNTYKDPI